MTLGGSELIPIISSAVSAAFVAYISVRKQGKDEQQSLFAQARDMHKSCEEENKRLAARIERLEEHLFPKL